MKALAIRLALLGLLGISSFLLFPLEQIVDAPLSPAALRLLALVQPTILMLAMVLLGSLLAPKVRLDAPLVRGWIEKRPLRPILEAQIPAAVVGGLVAALAILGFEIILKTHLAAPGGAGSALAGLQAPLLTKLLYGGIVEELIARWGLMSFFVWLLSRAARGGGVPDWCYWGGNLVAALLFAAGHLPMLFALVADPPLWLVAAVMVGNTIPGLAFGWLFWKRGLEAAMIAHMLGHLLATGVSALLAMG